MNKISILAAGLLMIISASAQAGEKAKGGDDFRATAKEYQLTAKDLRKNGNKTKAEIKLKAAKHADKGEWTKIDWTEYHELSKKLSDKN